MLAGVERRSACSWVQSPADTVSHAMKRTQYKSPQAQVMWIRLGVEACDLGGRGKGTSLSSRPTRDS